MCRKYSVFLFDLDGTVTNSAPGIFNSLDYALKKLGLRGADRASMQKFIGPPLEYSFKNYYGLSEERTRDAIGYYRKYYRGKGIFENSVYDGLEDVLKNLKSAGGRLAIATSKPETFAVKITEHFGIAPYFDCVSGRKPDDMRVSKDDLILRALERCGAADKSEALMIGDRKYDVYGAHSAGVDCLGVLYGFGSREELVSAGADYLAENVEDILKFSR